LGEVKKCKWLDAYFGMFIIEGNNGFLTVKQWKETVGDVFEFHVTHYNHCENCQKIRANSKYCIKTVADENGHLKKKKVEISKDFICPQWEKHLPTK
jgi:hypothetical protein